ncbi:glutamate receptor 2.2-like [Chenopodium quinoa]|uniref:Receptor ligand binding region domain-containing protein n=1 Tax=Chenopodium quinoa TaxID=63459 RepID=A0A803NDZ0_CHEQI|nr:glutamate receptor 2.2-like [Chenopodium quinoa]
MAASNNQLGFVIFAMILVSFSISVMGDLESAFIVAHKKATLTKLSNGVECISVSIDLYNRGSLSRNISEAQFVVNLGEKSRVPIVSYSATSPSLSPMRNPYFIRATQDNSCQVQPISDLIQAFGWREVVPVYVANEFGGGIIPFLKFRRQESSIDAAEDRDIGDEEIKNGSFNPFNVEDRDREMSETSCTRRFITMRL